MTQPSLTIPDSSTIKLETADLEMMVLSMYETVKLMLDELQKLSLQMQIVTGEKVTEEDVEE
jgi:hypothetical protein